MINVGLLWPCSHSGIKSVSIWHQNKMLGPKGFSESAEETVVERTGPIHGAGELCSWQQPEVCVRH